MFEAALQIVDGLRRKRTARRKQEDNNLECAGKAQDFVSQISLSLIHVYELLAASTEKYKTLSSLHRDGAVQINQSEKLHRDQLSPGSYHHWPASTRSSAPTISGKFPTQLFPAN